MQPGDHELAASMILTASDNVTYRHIAYDLIIILLSMGIKVSMRQGISADA